MAKILRATPVVTGHGPRGIDQLGGLIGPEDSAARRPFASSIRERRAASPGHQPDQPTRKCSHCGERFALKPRRGRNLSSHKRPRPTRYHEGARYCSGTCRKLASKARRLAQQPSPENAPKSRRGTELLSTVTCAEFSAVISRPCEGEKTGRGSPKKPVLDPRIVPDDRWPGMYRLRLRDGSLTENMTNLTRAKDALAELRRRP
jgi:hypothetical protein